MGETSGKASGKPEPVKRSLILENKCRIPIINYYVEQKSPLFEDYAFTHNMVPVAEKRQEYMECREKYEKELAEVKNKRKALDA